ncbi:lactate utilization protein B [Corynebacterium sp.]|uniref:lactate utilization protein B n=1 Tax=Corynebacterium sp. TaxID=1720 RepID=UPI0026DC0C94|nr:lactate utilization protein B [Corynebacterium sp.]MDO4610147.1 lactate utilization protein B [Corynebacterium sp.]
MSAPATHAVPLGMPAMPPTAPDGVGHLRGAETFTSAAVHELANGQLRANLRKATHTIRAKRAGVVAELPDWEDLRLAGSAVKRDVMARLPELLEEFERQVVARGGHVHWARDAVEANRIVADLVEERGARDVVKVKSMATQEIGLNEALADRGIHAQETDLAELIVQLGGDAPSHILVPAIHRNRDEIRDIFLDGIPGVRGDLTNEPADLAEAARLFLRRRFMEADVAISGANFGVAETGTVGVVESEGNGRMCVTLPRTLITVMGIEKLLPRFTDLEVFLQLLPRSSTGERMNPYTSLWTGVTDGDGPEDFHVVLLDNGRTAALADPVGREALKCIRCSACLNICPVYERAGGHAYGSVYPGPIGAILSPQLTGIDSAKDPNASLPYASSLCGACFEVCPVRIDIPAALLELRNRKVRDHRPPVEGRLFGLLGAVMGDRRLWATAVRSASMARLLGHGPFGGDGAITDLPGFLGGWTDARDTRVPPKRPFRAWWGSDDARAELADERAHQVPSRVNGRAGGGSGSGADGAGPRVARDSRDDEGSAR